MNYTKKLHELLNKPYDIFEMMELNSEVYDVLENTRDMSMDDYNRLRETEAIRRATLDIVICGESYEEFKNDGTYESLVKDLPKTPLCHLETLHGILTGSGLLYDSLIFEVAPIANYLKSLESYKMSQLEILDKCESILEALTICELEVFNLSLKLSEIFKEFIEDKTLDSLKVGLLRYKGRNLNDSDLEIITSN